MPTELPPKKPDQILSPLGDQRLDRALNWLAVVVGIGLCLWALTVGFPSAQHPGSNIETPPLSD